MCIYKWLLSYKHIYHIRNYFDLVSAPYFHSPFKVKAVYICELQPFNFESKVIF